MANDILLQAKVQGLYESILSDARRAERHINQTLGRVRLNNIEAPLGRIGRQAAEFEKSFQAATARVISFGASLAAISTAERAFSQMVAQSVKVERALVDIDLALNVTKKQLGEFSISLFKVAKDTGQSFDTVSQAALEFSRQGLGVKETIQRTRDALILVRRSGIDAGTAIQGLTAIINGFNKESLTSTEIINKLVAADIRFAVSAGDLVQAFSRVGSSAQDAGVDINELVGLITSLRQTTGRNASVIGNSLKTIFTRLSRPETLKDLEQIGVTTGYATGQFKDALSIITQLAQRYKTLDDAGRSYVSQLVGGVYQVNQLKAALDDLGRGRLSIAARATETARNATDEAVQGIEKLNQTLGDRINRLKESLNQAFANFGSGGLNKPVVRLVDIGQSVLDSINPKEGEKAGSQLGQAIVRGIGDFLAGPGLVIVGTLFTKLLLATSRYAGGAIKSFLNIGTQAEKVRDLQVRINEALRAQGTSYNAIIAKTGDRLAAEAEILRIIQQQGIAQRDIVGGAAASLYQKGLRFSESRGFIQTSTTRNLDIKRAVTGAGGILPSVIKEAEDVSKGVGGASPSAKPVVIPNFSFGGGKRGPVVANTDEYYVPNYGGGSAIFNKQMAQKLGLPLGAQKLTPGGSYAYGGFQNLIGSGFTSNVYRGSGRLEDLVFKQLRLAGSFSKDFLIKNEYNISKAAERAGLPVAKVFGSLGGSLRRGGLAKEYVEGFSGRDLENVKLDEDVRRRIGDKFITKGINPKDLNRDNYLIQLNAREFDLARNIALRNYTSNKGIYNSTVDFLASRSKVIDSGSFFNFARGFQPGNPYRFRRQTGAAFLSEIGELGYPEARAKLERELKVSPGLSESQFLDLLAFKRKTSVRKAFEYLQERGQRIEKEGLYKGLPSSLTGTGPGGTITQPDIDVQRQRIALERGLYGYPTRKLTTENKQFFDTQAERELAQQAQAIRNRVSTANLSVSRFESRQSPSGALIFDANRFLGRELRSRGIGAPIAGGISRSANVLSRFENRYASSGSGSTILDQYGNPYAQPFQSERQIRNNFNTLGLDPETYARFSQRQNTQGRFPRNRGFVSQNTDDVYERFLARQRKPDQIELDFAKYQRDNPVRIGGSPPIPPLPRSPQLFTTPEGQRFRLPYGRGPAPLSYLERRPEERGQINLENFSNAFLGVGVNRSRLEAVNRIRGNLTGSDLNRSYFASVAKISNPANTNFTQQLEREFQQNFDKVFKSAGGFARSLQLAAEKVQASGASVEQIKKATSTLIPNLVRYSESVKQQNTVANQFFATQRNAVRFQNVSEKLGRGETLGGADQRFYEQRIRRQVLEKQITAYQQQTGQNFFQLNRPLQRRLLGRFAADADPIRRGILAENRYAQLQTQFSQQPLGLRERLGGFFTGNIENRREIRALQQLIKEQEGTLGAGIVPYKDRLEGFKAQGRANFRGRVQNAAIIGSLGLSLGAGAFEGKSPVASGAFQGASLGSLGFFGGPVVGGITTGAGALIGGGVAAINKLGTNVDDLTERLEKMSAAVAQNVDASTNYIQTLAKLEEGTTTGTLSAREQAKLQKIQQNFLNSITDTTFLRNLAGAGTSSEALDVQSRYQERNNDIINQNSVVAQTAQLNQGRGYGDIIGLNRGGLRGFADLLENNKILRVLSDVVTLGAAETVPGQLRRIAGTGERLSENDLKRVSENFATKSGLSTNATLRDELSNILKGPQTRENLVKGLDKLFPDLGKQIDDFKDLSEVTLVLSRSLQNAKEKADLLALSNEKEAKRQEVRLNFADELEKYARSVSRFETQGIASASQRNVGVIRARNYLNGPFSGAAAEQREQLEAAIQVQSVRNNRSSQIREAQVRLAGKVADIIPPDQEQFASGTLKTLREQIDEGIGIDQIVERLRKLKSITAGLDNTKLQKSINDFKDAIEKIDTTAQAQINELTEELRGAADLSRRERLRGFIGGQSPLDAYNESRKNPNFLSELYGTAPKLPGYTIRNNRGGANLGQLIEEANSLRDQDRLFRGIGVRPTQRQSNRFEIAQTQIGQGFLADFFGKQLRTAGASNDILREVGVSDISGRGRTLSDRIGGALGRVNNRLEFAPRDESLRAQRDVLENYQKAVAKSPEAGKILAQDLGLSSLSKDIRDALGGGSTLGDVKTAVDNLGKIFTGETGPGKGIQGPAADTVAQKLADLTTFFDRFGRKQEGTIEGLDRASGNFSFRNKAGELREVPFNAFGVGSQQAIFDKLDPTGVGRQFYGGAFFRNVDKVPQIGPTVAGLPLQTNRTQGSNFNLDPLKGFQTLQKLFDDLGDKFAAKTLGAFVEGAKEQRKTIAELSNLASGGGLVAQLKGEVQVYLNDPNAANLAQLRATQDALQKQIEELETKLTGVDRNAQNKAPLPPKKVISTLEKAYTVGN